MQRNTPAESCDRRTAHRGAIRLALLTAAIAVAAVTGCAGTMPARSSAIDRLELVKSATFDHGCPADDIRVVGEQKSPAGGSIFVVDVCGIRRHYTRIGSMYFDADRSGS